jgi:hypothetical protein
LEPLSIILETDELVTSTISAQDNHPLELEGWKSLWYMPARKQMKILRLSNQAKKLRYFHRAPKFKYGFFEVLEGRRNGNTEWYAAMNLEMPQLLDDYPTFSTSEDILGKITPERKKKKKLLHVYDIALESVYSDTSACLLEAHTKEKVPVVCGLCTPSLSWWHEDFADNPSCKNKVKHVLWMWPNSDVYREHIAIPGDDLATIPMLRPREFTQLIIDKYKVKLDETAPSSTTTTTSLWLGCNLIRDDNGTLCLKPHKYTASYYKEQMCDKKPSLKVIPPLKKIDHTELDDSDPCRWDTEEVRPGFRSGMPGKGHLVCTNCVVAYWKKKKSRMCICSAPPLVGCNCASASSAYGCPVIGILHFINMTPIDWFSKHQLAVETVTDGSEFVAASTKVKEQVMDLHDTLDYSGVPICGMHMDWKKLKVTEPSIVDGSKQPHPKLHKWHLLLPQICEAVTAGIVGFFHIPEDCNPADIFSKHWGYKQVWQLLQPPLSLQGDTMDSEGHSPGVVND